MQTNWASLILVWGLALMLAACGQTTPGTVAATTPAATPTTTSAATTPVVSLPTATPLPTVTAQPSPIASTTSVATNTAAPTATAIVAATATAIPPTAALTTATASPTAATTATVAPTTSSTVVATTPSPAVTATGQLAYLDSGNLYLYDFSDQSKKLIYQATGISGLTGTPAWSPDNSQMAIVLQLDTKNPNSITNLYLMKLNGSAPQLLSTGNATNCASNPVWSPDGSMLAFEVVINKGNARQCLPTDPREIWIATANGQNPHKVTDGLQPIWSADDKSLLYATNGQLPKEANFRQNNALHLIAIADGTDKEIVATKDIPSDLTSFGYPFHFDPGTSFLQYPVFLDSGAVIGFSTRGSSALVATVKTDGSNFKLWSGNPEGGFGQTYVNSSKDNLLMYQSYPPSGIPAIAIIDINSPPLPMRVTTIQLGGAQIKESAVQPAWSPDGQMVAYLYLTGDYPPASTNTNTGLAVVTISGMKATNPQTLAKGAITSVAWSH